MYQRLQRWVLDAKSMLTLTEVAVTSSAPCWVEIKHSAVEVGVGRHEPIFGLLLLLLLVVIVIIVVFSVVVIGLALTESALTEWSLMKEGCVRQRKKMRFKKIFKRVARNIEQCKRLPPLVHHQLRRQQQVSRSTALPPVWNFYSPMRSWLQCVIF